MRVILLILFVLSSLSTHVYAGAAPTVFSRDVINVVHRFYMENDFEITRNELAEQLIEEQYLLDLARKDYPYLLIRQSDVGFSTKYHQMRYVNDLLSSDDLGNSRKSLKSMITIDGLKKRLGPYPVTGTLPSHTLQALSDTLVPGYRLKDAYLDASMQARYKLHLGDVEQLTQLARVFEQYQYNMARLSEEARVQLEALTLAKVIATQVKTELGVVETLHSHSDVLKIYQEQVSQQEIAHYYNKNKSDFKYLASVRATIVEFNERKLAEKYRQDKSRISSKEFKKVANDQLIERKQISNHFALQAAFNLSPKRGEVIIRTPKSRWLLISVHEQNRAYYPENSETVRYIASKVIAKTMAKQMYYRNFATWRELHKL